MSETILVTGAAGYIGSILTDYLLADGHRVVAVDDLRYPHSKAAILPYLGHPNYQLHQLDVRKTDDLLALAQERYCQEVIWLAALVGAPICDRQPEAAVAINQTAVERFVAAWPRQKPFIYLNTNSGYGSTDGTSQVTEDSPLAPVSLYGLTKVAAEKAVLSHPRGLSLRLATVFGVSPRMRFDLLVNDWTQQLYRLWYGCADDVVTGAAGFQVYEPHYKRNFVHVRDVCRAIRHLRYARDRAGERVFNVGLPTANLSKLELAQAICSRLSIPDSVVRVAHGRDPDQRNYIVSSQRLLMTGFGFRHSLEEGVEEVARMVGLFEPEETYEMRNV